MTDQNKKPTIYGPSSGFATLLATVLILSVTMVIGVSIGFLALNQIRISRGVIASAQSYYVAEAGIEDSLYRVIKDKNYEATNSLAVGEGATTINISEGLDDITITSEGDIQNRTRNLEITLATDTAELDFHYGAQVDRGGLQIKVNASVIGNVYSNGSITGVSKGSTQAITGDAWVAGATSSPTYIDKVWVGTDAHANTITNSWIDGDAYYQTIDEATTVGGTKYPASPDPPVKDLPLTYANIQAWEEAAEAGGVIDGDYEPPKGSSLGPIKIDGNLTFPKNSKDEPTTITGPVWVTGDILAENNVHVKLQEGISFGYVVIADNPDDQVNYGRIEFNNNVTTEDSSEGGYLLFISTNKSLDEGNSAVWLHNNINKDSAQSIIFSLYGLIKVENNAKFKEITGYAIYLENNAEIVYESGLINTDFSSGPSGGWGILSWKEIP